MNFLQEIEKLAKNIQVPDTTNPKPDLKRKADEISQSSYEDANKELRELFLARQKTRETNLPPDNDPNNPVQKVTIDLSNNKRVVEEESKGQKLTKGNSMTETRPAVNTQQQQQQLATQNKDHIFWINKLRVYPPDHLLDHMITFRQLMYEDLLKNNPKNPPRTLQAAFMTTFGYSVALIEHLIKGGVKLVLSDEWSDIKEPRIEKNYQGYSNFTLIRSPKDPSRKFTGAFHPKIWLLRFPTFLRVVVTSGNLTIDDWTTWSNCLWFKDFPKKSLMLSVPEKKPVPEGAFDFDGDFTQTLKTFIQKLMPYPEKMDYKNLLDINIDDYYISDIDIVLIASVPGRHTGEELEKYGHRRVSSVLKKIGFSNPDSLSRNKKHVLTYQTSSIGNLDEKFLKEILSSFLPNYLRPEELKEKPEKKLKKGKTLTDMFGGGKKEEQPEETKQAVDPAASRVKLVFPTKEYVENTHEGPDFSGCLILNPDAYQKPTFEKGIFHKFQGVEDYFFHEGIIPHLKVWLVTEESGEVTDDTYIYFGSHNFSPSAWGRYEKDCTQISISNTELGVLYPPRQGTKANKEKIIRNLPFKVPPQKYGANEVPWMFKEHYQPSMASMSGFM